MILAIFDPRAILKPIWEVARIPAMEQHTRITRQLIEKGKSQQEISYLLGTLRDVVLLSDRV